MVRLHLVLSFQTSVLLHLLLNVKRKLILGLNFLMLALVLSLSLSYLSD